MKFPIFLITVYIISSPWVNSLVVTKIDMFSFMNYYQNEIMERNVASSKGLFKYCDQLREAKIFNSVNTSAASLQKSSIIRLSSPNKILEGERDDAQMQLFNIRFGSSQDAITLRGFKCVDNVKNISWIVSPALVSKSGIPESAFLFEFQLNFRNMSVRGVHEKTKVSARSVAFVDQDGTGSRRNIDKILLKYKEESYERDALCDLNIVLKYRLCSLAVNTLIGEQPLSDDLPANTASFRNNTVKEINQFFDFYESEDGCDPREISDRTYRNNKKSAIREMLHCPTSQQITSDDQLYISLDPFDSTTILCRLETEAILTQYIHPYYWQLQIPLLRHINLTNALN